MKKATEQIPKIALNILVLIRLCHTPKRLGSLRLCQYKSRSYQQDLYL